MPKLIAPPLGPPCLFPEMIGPTPNTILMVVHVRSPSSAPRAPFGILYLLFRDRVMTADFISRMVTISITPEAFAAIEATLAKGSTADARPDGKGGYLQESRYIGPIRDGPLFDIIWKSGVLLCALDLLAG